MSGYYGELERGKPVLHHGSRKIVKDWFFISEPGHNSDSIVVQFNDGTVSSNGFRDIEYITQKLQRDRTDPLYGRQMFS